MMRMIPSESSASATRYFDKELSRGDYYADKGELPGTWHGKGAALLGLSGEVTREAFAALADNRHPETGKRVTPRQKADRRAGYDFTFSAPKSVSAFYEYLRASGRDEQANALLDVFRTSVRETMAELEPDMRVRVRTGGQNSDRVSGNMIWAEFTHFQSRPVDGFSDPHLHIHAFAMNMSHDGAGWKAGEFGSINKDAYYYQEAFHARLGAALQGLGYAVQATTKGFQLAGVERATVDKFSRRRDEIERRAAEKGIVYAEDKARLGAATRKNKDEGLPPEETRALFMARLSEAERATFERIAGGDGFAPSAMTADAAIDYALAHSFERSSAIRAKALLAEALKIGVGSVSPEAIQQAAASRPEILRGVVKGQAMVTTREVLAEEQAMLDFARRGRAQLVPVAGLRPDDAPAWEFRRAWLAEEQRQAVLHVLHSTDRVTGIRGGAGTGKTAMMQETVEAVAELTGKAPVVLAPSAEASRGVLRGEGFADADTVASFLLSSEQQARAKDGVIFVDEAGLMGSRTMRALFAVAERQNARIVLQGDVRQHAAVERGDALRILEKKGGVKFAELETIRRQKPEDYRHAIAKIAEGAVAEGFARLDAMGAIVEVSDGTRHAALASAYLNARTGGDTALVVSPTHAEGERVTALIREGLKVRGALGEERAATQLVPTNWTEAERGRAANYSAGQVVSFHQNAKGFARGERATVFAVDSDTVLVRTAANGLKALPLAAAKQFNVFEQRELGLAVGDTIRLTQNGKDARGGRLNNGAVYRVEGFSADGGLKVMPESGGAARVLPKEFGHLAHGYVTTSHAAQGKTVDHVFIAQGAESLVASSREQFYVSASRGKRSVRIYTDDKAELARAVERSGERVAASELVAGDEGAGPSAKTVRLHERITAKALELARRAMQWQGEREHYDGERFGIALRGWPRDGRERGLEPAR